MPNYNKMQSTVEMVAETYAEKTTVNVPGRLMDFYSGGGAYQAWDGGQGNPDHRDWPEGGELELFQACSTAKRIKPSKGGYYVRVALSVRGISALRYWAETLEAASGDDASWEPEARNDLRAAQRVLKVLG